MNCEHSDSERCNDLQKVLEISRALAATEDLDALLGLIVRRSMELLDAQRATVFLYDAVTNELVSRVATGEREIRTSAERGIAGATAKTRSTINVPDAYADDRFNREVDRLTGFRTRNILSLPLLNHSGELVGVLQVLNKSQGAFDAYDVELAESLAAQAGVVLQRARLIEHYLQKQQMERAMTIARDIQRGLLPAGAPSVCGFDIAGYSQPADETGGDTYDFMQLPDGRWMFVVADATGHGIGPALVIAETRAMLRAMSLQADGVPIVLSHVNNLLAADLGDARFVTCFFGLMDPLEPSLTYASAGHGPMLFYTRTTDQFEQVSATSLPLGIMAQADYDQVIRFEFGCGDMAVVTTDGFFEAVNAAGEPFGMERMMDLLRRDRDLPAQQILRNLAAAVVDFTGDAPQLDDLTAVVIRRR